MADHAGDLRDSTVETHWASGVLPVGTPVVLYAPPFHRDDTRLPEAHRFAPELWLRERTDDDWPLVPFSGGPGECAGRNLVLLMGSVPLATLLRGHDVALTGNVLRPDRPRPGTLSPFRLRFELRRRSPVSAGVLLRRTAPGSAAPPGTPRRPAR